MMNPVPKEPRARENRGRGFVLRSQVRDQFTRSEYGAGVRFQQVEPASQAVLERWLDGAERTTRAVG